jgi:hypothetical protein
MSSGVSLTADVARLAAMNVEALDRLTVAVFSGSRHHLADMRAHVEAVLTEMTKIAERLAGGFTDGNATLTEDYVRGHLAGFAKGAASTVDDEVVHLRAIRSAWIDFVDDIEIPVDMPEDVAEVDLPKYVAAAFEGELGRLRGDIGALVAVARQTITRIEACTSQSFHADEAVGALKRYLDNMQAAGEVSA